MCEMKHTWRRMKWALVAFVAFTAMLSVQVVQAESQKRADPYAGYQNRQDLRNRYAVQPPAQVRQAHLRAQQAQQQRAQARSNQRGDVVARASIPETLPTETSIAQLASRSDESVAQAVAQSRQQQQLSAQTQPVANTSIYQANQAAASRQGYVEDTHLIYGPSRQVNRLAQSPQVIYVDRPIVRYQSGCCMRRCAGPCYLNRRVVYRVDPWCGSRYRHGYYRSSSVFISTGSSWGYRSRCDRRWSGSSISIRIGF